MPRRTRSDKFTGVTYIKDKDLWKARITFSGVRYYLGKFKSYDKAVETYKAALAAGGIVTKSWCNTMVEYRGQLGASVAVGASQLVEEEEKLRKFSFLTVDEGS